MGAEYRVFAPASNSVGALRGPWLVLVTTPAAVLANVIAGVHCLTRHFNSAGRTNYF